MMSERSVAPTKTSFQHWHQPPVSSDEAASKNRPSVRLEEGATSHLNHPKSLLVQRPTTPKNKQKPLDVPKKFSAPAFAEQRGWPRGQDPVPRHASSCGDTVVMI